MSFNFVQSYRLAKPPISLLYGDGRIDPEKPSAFEACRVLDPQPNRKALQKAQHQFGKLYPAFAGLKLVKTWAGMIDALPDAIPAIGEWKSRLGLYLLTGLSGHGFGFGLGAGSLLAQEIAEGKAFIDLSAFRPSRFEEGCPIEPYTGL
jgi:glycine/D-amino acid oxidase-like deaminating enzyme